MNGLSFQRGVGLVEVLVAVLLLSVAILGFSALQVRAISATDESLVRTKSLTLVRNLAEVMRAYPESYVTGSGTSFSSGSSTDTGAQPTIQAVVSSTAVDTVIIDTEEISINGDNNCLSTSAIPCNINQLVAREGLLIKKMAADSDIALSVATCPGTSTASIQNQMCIITAWNGTQAIISDADDACATTNGVYKLGSHCLISEAY